MSEQRDDAAEFDDAATEQEEGAEVAPEAGEGEGEDESGDEDGDKPAKSVDWEKRAHSNAGQAAAERSRRRAAERRASELSERIERLEASSGSAERDELLELIGGLSDDDEDPVGDIASVKRALKLFQARELAQAEQSRTQSAAQRQVNVLKSSMADAEADFTLDHPDYGEAAAFYRKARTEELTEAGYTGEALNQQLASDLFGLVKTAFNGGLDPAERVYNLAKKRGFKVGQKAADAKLGALDRAGNSGVRPQARPAAGVLSWGDVAKLDGAARDKAWAALRQREKGRK